MSPPSDPLDRPRIAVVVFPGSNDDRDAVLALESLGADAVLVWHGDDALPAGTGGVVLPGGFSYGDYLRCGAIGRFAPAMDEVRRFADEGGLVLGICNGFQILCEAGLLPGVLRPNRQLEFVCEDVTVRVESSSTVFTESCSVGDELVIPVKHGEGCWYADDETLANQAADAAYARFKQLDRIMSDYDPDSEVMRLCAASSLGKPVSISDDLAKAVEQANKLEMLPKPIANEMKATQQTFQNQVADALHDLGRRLGEDANAKQTPAPDLKDLQQRSERVQKEMEGIKNRLDALAEARKGMREDLRRAMEQLQRELMNENGKLTARELEQLREFLARMREQNFRPRSPRSKRKLTQHCESNSPQPSRSGRRRGENTREWSGRFCEPMLRERSFARKFRSLTTNWCNLICGNRITPTF